MLRVPSARFRNRRRVVTAVAIAAVAALGLGACGRSSGGGGGTTGGSAGPSTKASASTATAGPGDFGSLKKICGPGNAKGATERGVTDTEIHIGVTADPGAAAAPGLEQEFFDTADGFSKWCNAAGGINGRKIVVDKLDAKLFNVGQVMTRRLPEGLHAGRQRQRVRQRRREDPRRAASSARSRRYVVSPRGGRPRRYRCRPPRSRRRRSTTARMRLLADAYPDTKPGRRHRQQHLASLVPSGLRTARSTCVTSASRSPSIQEQPPLVDNYRPYMEQLKGAGARAYYEISAQDPSPDRAGHEEHRLQPVVDPLQRPVLRAAGGAGGQGHSGLPAELRAVQRAAVRARQPVPGAPADREHREGAVSNPKLTASPLRPSARGRCGRSRRPHAGRTSRPPASPEGRSSTATGPPAGCTRHTAPRWTRKPRPASPSSS